MGAPKLSLRVTGKWMITFQTTDLTGGGGSDFAPELESPMGVVNLNLSKLTDPDFTPWQMDISRVDVNWPAPFRLYVRRNTDGTGTGSVSGGLVYQEVTLVNQLLFTGVGDRTKIDMQYRLTGISVSTMNVENYSTTIYYTVTDL